MKLQRILVATALFVVASLLANGQVQTGTPKFASFGGGSVDTIDLGNLNIHFDFPIVSRPGRGTSFYYSIKYDNSIWSIGGSTWLPATNFGWQVESSGFVGSIHYNTQN